MVTKSIFLIYWFQPASDQTRNKSGLCRLLVYLLLLLLLTLLCVLLVKREFSSLLAWNIIFNLLIERRGFMALHTSRVAVAVATTGSTGRNHSVSWLGRWYRRFLHFQLPEFLHVLWCLYIWGLVSCLYVFLVLRTSSSLRKRNVKINAK